MSAPRLKWWKSALALLVSAAGLALVFRRVDAAQLRPLLQNASPAWFLAAVGCFGVACAASAARWHLTLKLSGQAVGAGATLRGFLVGHFWSLALLGGAGGDVARSACYARWHRRPFPEVAASAPLERTLGFLGAMLVGLIAAGVSGLRGRLPEPEQLQLRAPSTGLVLAILGGIVTVIVLTILFMRRRPAQSGWNRFFATAGNGFRTLATRPALATGGVALGLLTQFAIASTTACCLEAVGAVGFVWADMFWTLTVVSMATAVPSVGGLGVRESAALAMLGLYGVPAEPAVSAALLAFLPQLLWAGVGALCFWREETAAARALG